jgi:alpha-glucosidase
LRGTICLYAGEEIGMVDGLDTETSPRDRFGRDRQRTPMQWDASPGGGFTHGDPWLPLVDPGIRNVATQTADPGSLLSLYRRLLELRRSSAALRHGALELVPDLPPGLIGWIRSHAAERVLVIGNMGDAAATVDLRQFGDRGEILVATGPQGGQAALDRLNLDPNEGLLLRL